MSTFMASIVHAGVYLFVGVIILSRLLELMAHASRDAWEVLKDEWGDYFRGR